MSKGLYEVEVFHSAGGADWVIEATCHVRGRDFDPTDVRLVAARPDDYSHGPAMPFDMWAKLEGIGDVAVDAIHRDAVDAVANQFDEQDETCGEDCDPDWGE